MLRRLAEKGLLNYENYRGVQLTAEGQRLALLTIRKHRLWEVFLVQQLGFNWDEVHEVAEELEHVQSPLLMRRLDAFLGLPALDPHGDPIPAEDGAMRRPATPPAGRPGARASTARWRPSKTPRPLPAVP